MSSKYLITLPVVAVMALTGCETSNTSGLEALDNTVLEMTRTDVTQRSNGTSSRPNIDYQELGYRTALRASVLASPDFHAALQRFRESEAGIQVAQSGTRPQLSGGATAGAIGGGDRSEVETGLAANLSLSQLVFDGGQTRANIAGATAQAYSARARIDITGNDVAMRAAMAWRDLWQATTQLGMLQEQISEAEGLLQKIQRLISSGIIDRAAFAAGQRQLLDLKLEQERLQASKRDAQQRFNRYFGSQPASVTAPERLFTDAELARFVENWQNAPALIAAAAELISAERAVDAARAEGRPNVSVQAGAQTPLDRDDTADGNVGVVVRHVFMDGGRRAAQLTQRERALAAAQETFESQKDELFVEAQTALSRLRSLRASVSVLQAQIKELETERDTLRSQIASGQADLRQLVETEVTFYRTRARLIEIRGDIADLELKIVAGAGQLPERLGIGIEALLVSQQ